MLTVIGMVTMMIIIFLFLYLFVMMTIVVIVMVMAIVLMVMLMVDMLRFWRYWWAILFLIYPIVVMILETAVVMALAMITLIVEVLCLDRPSTVNVHSIRQGLVCRQVRLRIIFNHIQTHHRWLLDMIPYYMTILPKLHRGGFDNNGKAWASVNPGLTLADIHM